MPLEYTPVSDIPKIVAASRATFLTKRTLPLEFRKEQLRALERLVTENEEELLAAIYKDLHRPKDFELPTVLDAVKLFLEDLEKLTKDQKVDGPTENDDSFVRLSPLGSVLVIGAWNYPILLVLDPLAGAIAAGNTCVVKPSEVAEECAALLARLVPKYMDPSVVSIVNGAVEETTALLNQRFDHILYTGGTEVGKIIMGAAAKNLTPVTLELGGKCPVVVTQSADIAKAGQTIAFWKAMNSGQVCLSVNYILCPKNLQEPLIQTIIGTWKHLFGGSNGSGDFKDSADYPRIINKRQFDRLEQLLQKAKAQNTMVYGGKSDSENRYIEPSIFTNVSMEDEVMKDEIFGPLLPIIDCESIDDAINIVNQQEHALSLNIYSNNQEEIDRVLQETRSGAFIVNDIASHFGYSKLPFGGVGHSGIGGYHGKYSIETFSHKRAVMVRNVVRS